MGLLALPELLPRAVLPLPRGDNTTDTVINGVHFNTTALNFWNYTLYDNNTISNNSKCYLIFDQFRPTFLSNGSWVNATTCYVPIYGIKERGKLGIAFAALFSVILLFTLVCLKKHGQQFIRESKRFRLVGRRWQWYWMIFTCACGLIGTITSVDVDRDYLQDLAIVLQSFFFFLMYPGVMAVMWEAVRHWGSFQERQIVDRDQFALRTDDRRSQVEFFMPLVFYLFAWLNFFMVIPRSWTKIEKQHSPEQQAAIAAPAATDLRFKVGSIIAVFAYATILYQLKHHLHYYRGPGVTRLIKECPTKLWLALVVLAVRVGYGIASAWIWDISIMKYNGDPAWPYGAGYAPVVLILLIFCVAGLVEENEDRVIIKQRQERGRSTDAELGIVRKPRWWRKDVDNSDEARLRDLTSEVGGGQATSRRISRNIEMGNMGRDSMQKTPYSPSEGGSSGTPSPTIGLRKRSRSRPAEDGRYRDQRASSVYTDATTGSGDTAITGTTLGNMPQQRVRSMLDI